MTGKTLQRLNDRILTPLIASRKLGFIFLSRSMANSLALQFVFLCLVYTDATKPGSKDVLKPGRALQPVRRYRAFEVLLSQAFAPGFCS